MTTEEIQVEGSQIYYNNLKVLETRYPVIAQRLVDCVWSNKYDMLPTGENRNINLFNKEINGFYYDEENPVLEIKNFFEDFPKKNSKISVFLGFGLGYELQYFVENLSVKAGTQKILVVEKEIEFFKIACYMYDLRPMIEDSNIYLIVGEPTETIFTELATFMRQGVNIMFSKAMKFFYHPYPMKQDREYYMAVVKSIRESAMFVLRSFGNSPDDSLIGVEHILDNVNEIVSNPGINMLYDKFKGKPAVIVSTGPSLDKNKHLLKEIENKAVIIAADASLKVLMASGIKPHLVATLERFPLVEPMFSGFEKQEVENVFMASCPVIHKSVYETYPGPRVIVYRNFDHFRWIGIEKGILDIKQSSGNMAFKLATALGCNPIILIGQDLAYSRDGKTHAKDNVYGEKQADHYTDHMVANQMEVMGNDGMPILTHMDWNEFRKSYELDVKLYEGLCINSTEGGAYINGTQVMPLRESIDKYIVEDIDPIKIIRESIQSFSKDNIMDDIKTVREIVRTTVEELDGIRKICFERNEQINNQKEQLEKIVADEIELTSELISWIKEAYSGTFADKIKIIREYPRMQTFMMHIFQSYYIRFEIELNAIPDQFEKDEQIMSQMVLHFQKFFSVLHDLINICENSLLLAQKNLETLHDEVDANEK